MPPGRRTLAYVEANSICGYACVRACRQGHRIGPLFADTPEIAERLFAGLAGRLYGAPIFLDVPEPNGEAVALAEAPRARAGLRDGAHVSRPGAGAAAGAHLRHHHLRAG